MADLLVDTYKLNRYAQRISDVNSRIRRLDRRLDSLYTRVGLLGLWKLMQADALTCYSVRLVLCKNYLEQTAADFEKVESELLREDPVNFTGVFEVPVFADLIQTLGRNIIYFNNESVTNAVSSLWDAIKGEISDIPEDIMSAGEALSWIEKQCGKIPNWITLGADILIPSSLKDAYTLTSGLLQGDLTLEEGWDVVKHMLSSNTKLEAICETLDYTFDKGLKHNEEMEKQIYEQLGEGDLLGAVFEGAEGFVDGIIGGSIEVLGDVGGGAVDDLIDNVPVVKGLNMLAEYGTGLLGWNEGEGYSVGGLIGFGAEKIAEGIDFATDVVTDATDYVTDAVTGGIKSGINWVKGWFD